jgi:hypothetical protein
MANSKILRFNIEDSISRYRQVQRGGAAAAGLISVYGCPARTGSPSSLAPQAFKYISASSGRKTSAFRGEVLVRHIPSRMIP